MRAKQGQKIILGAGMTGLSSGFASGLPVFEASKYPGGICSSYYIQPGSSIRILGNDVNMDAYRFEIGGGHWIFGADSISTQFMGRFVKLRSYNRISSVFFRKNDLYVPFPLQNHLRVFDSETTAKAISEMSRSTGSARTMEEWLENSFGPTLCELFFYPFHELYTADLYKRIAPQDAYKSPVDLKSVIEGALQNTRPVGYNTTFLYPQEGLDKLATKIAEQCKVNYQKRVVAIDLNARSVTFSDGQTVQYQQIISTLPLNKTIQLAGFKNSESTDPYTSVLVLNIGAEKGDRCPEDHWLYTPDSKARFHRVGFYSNVDKSFLPRDGYDSKVSIYVERAFYGVKKPTDPEIKAYTDAVIAELQEWGFIGDVEVADPTWIDVAYTWAWPESKWKTWAIDKLAENGILQVGRYGLWRFHGITESIRDGLYAGAAMRQDRAL